MSKLSAGWSKTEDPAIREYIERATSGLGGIKNLTWRFLVANTAIASFLISHRSDARGIEGIIIITFGCLCAVSIFIACHSFVKLKERRIELRELYKMFQFMDVIRPDYRIIVGNYDLGDWIFLISGIALPLLLLNIIFRALYIERYSYCCVSAILMLSLIFVVCLATVSYGFAKCVEREREELLLHPEKTGEIPTEWWKGTRSCLWRGRFTKSDSK